MKHVASTILVAFLLGTSVSAQTPITVRGRLLQADGQPMQQARIAVENGPADTTFAVDVDADGGFAFQLAQEGGYGLIWHGAQDEEQEIPLIVTNRLPIELEIRSGTEPIIKATPKPIAEIASIYLDVERRERAGVTAEDREKYRDLIEKEQDELVRHWLLLRYMDELHPTGADSILAQQLFAEVPTTSPLWSFEAWSPVGASNILAVANRTLRQPEIAQVYVERGAEEHSDPDVQAQFLYVGFYVADERGDEEAKERYYRRLATEHTETRQYENVRRVYDPDRAIQAGKPVPDFGFVSLADSSVVYTRDGLEGKTYLIDSWGTWCAPCIAEMPYLHEAYEKYHSEGFEILSVAFIDERASIEAFRGEQYPMPWLHTLVASEDDSAVRAKFEITGFPRPILVSEEGIILATNEALRGEKLLKVLEGVFARESSDGK